MENIKTVGEFRKLLENFEDDWILNIELQKKSDLPGLINPLYTETLIIENKLLDICHSEKIITVMAYDNEDEI